MNRQLLILLAFLMSFAPVPSVAASDLAAASATAGTWQAKVDSWVMDRAGSGETEFLVFLQEQADLRGAKLFRTKAQKGEYVYRTLAETARRTQEPLLRDLRNRGIPHRAFWVANMIWVRGSLSTVSDMARRNDVAQVFANPVVALKRPIAAEPAAGIDSVNAVEWNLTRVNAPAAWSAGYRGQGAVVGGQDTGYQWEHSALKGKYRGWNGAVADHNYNWHDAIHSGSGVCGADSPAPCDDYSHGTHTMGTMVGDDGGANRIGMAPGARWIGCRNMKQGNGTPATYAECYQWFIAPTRIDGSDPDPSMAPDVINNSWHCTAAEGCTDPQVLLTVVESVRAAGILTVHSAGNSGPACSTINEPATIYESSTSVAATDSNDAIYNLSSRGPVTVDGSGRRKPDVAAPGVSIRSSVPSGAYTTMSGTSMAAPHVAGLAALILSAKPALAGEVDLLDYLIERSALALTTTQGCGGDGPADVPNNVFGWGRIDALAAVNAALGAGSLAVTISPPEAVTAGGQWRRIGTETWLNSGSTETGIPVGSCTVEFKAVTGWTTPSSVEVTISNGVTTTAGGTYVQPAGTVVVNPDPDSINAPWTLTGPNIYSQSGTGDQTLSNLPVGNYTIAWGDVAGWTKPSPASETKAVRDGATTIFTGTYSQSGGFYVIPNKKGGAAVIYLE